MASNREFFLDRIEGETAVLMSGETALNIPRSLLPPEAREGDHLTLSLTVDRSSRSRTEKEISDLHRHLSTDENGNSL
ncbi:MAG: DUF3006 domain-containing protein [Actinomycetota bacterium]